MTEEKSENISSHEHEKIIDENPEENKKHVEKIEDKKIKNKSDEKKIKKEKAFTMGRNLHLSKKHGMYICSFIKMKKIEDAMKDLGLVLKYKKAVPFKGEIPHRKGKGMMSGRYPVKAVGVFVNLLKTLKGNSIVNGFDIDKTIISSAFASWGSRPLRKGNMRGKRTNVVLEAKEMAGVRN